MRSTTARRQEVEIAVGPSDETVDAYADKYRRFHDRAQSLRQRTRGVRINNIERSLVVDSATARRPAT